MRILAIDPGSVESAYVVYHSGNIVRAEKIDNNTLLRFLFTRPDDEEVLAIEAIASYGMAVGAEVFETCIWIGRFIQIWTPRPVRQVYRKDVKMHLCGSMKAKDANIRQAIIDLYGGKEKAIGKKKTPGPLYGISADRWSALAVAITATHKEMAA